MENNQATARKPSEPTFIILVTSTEEQGAAGSHTAHQGIFQVYFDLGCMLFRLSFDIRWQTTEDQSLQRWPDYFFRSFTNPKSKHRVFTIM